MSTQRFKVQGDLEVVTSPKPGTTTTLGNIMFTNEVAKDLGKIKTYGNSKIPDKYRFIIDVAGCGSGMAIRTDAYEGTTEEEGQGKFYTFNCDNSYTTINSRTILAPAYYNTDTPNETLNVSKSADSIGSNPPAYTDICRYYMSSFNEGQALCTVLGRGTFGTGLINGYHYSTTAASIYGFLGTRSGSTSSTKELIKLYQTSGLVEIPGNITVGGTITATTYLNLPALTPAQILPITLDTTNNRVGVNKTTPTEALDVVGNAKVTGTVTADTVSAQHYLNLPSPNVSPITLDAANLRVGIDTPTPQYTLDVNGDAHVMGTVIGDTAMLTTEFQATKATVVNELFLTNIASATKSEVLYYDPVTHGVSHGTAPSSDVAPITLDNTNNRVGINVSVPEEALDVDGNIQTTGDLVVDGQVYLQGLLNESKSQVLYYDFITKKVSHASIPTTDLTPITLFNTTTPVAVSRVGINNPSPTVTLDVTGDIKASGTIVSSGGLGGTLSTAAQPNITSVGTLTSLGVTGAVAAGTLTLTNPPAKTTETNILYYNPTSKTVSYGTSPTPQVGSTVLVKLEANKTLTTTASSMLSFSLPYIGTYRITLAVRGLTFGTGTNLSISTSPTTFAYSYPQTIRIFISGTLHQNVQTYFTVLYTTTTAGGTYYLTAMNNGTGETIAANETQLIASYVGVLP